MVHSLPPEAVSRFKERLRTLENGCVDYMGGKIKGYGKHHVAGSSHQNTERWDYAHRIAWRLHNNTDIPEGMRVRFACGTKGCCHGPHLYLSGGDKLDDQA